MRCQAGGTGKVNRLAEGGPLCYDFTMKITCPDCGFSRDLPSDRVPAKPVIATCPHCACRFRLVPEDASSHVLRHGTDNAQHQDGDDPLPPGAIVPGAPSGQTMPEDRPSAAEDAPHPEDERTSREERRRQRHANQTAEATEDSVPDEGNPWDMAPYPSGYASAFYQTSLRVMFGAGRFFARLDPEAPQLRALLYYLVVVLALVVSQFVWTSMSRDILEQAIAQNNSIFGQVLRFSLTHPLLFALVSVASLVLQIYVISALLLLGYRLTGVRHASFVIMFQIMAYSAAPVLLSIIPLLGSQVGVVWSIACIVNGCRVAFRLDWPRTLLGLMPLLLFLFVMFGSLPV